VTFYASIVEETFFQFEVCRNF